MKAILLVPALLAGLSPSTVAQADPPDHPVVGGLRCYADGSIGGVVAAADDSTEFHLRVTAAHCELWLGGSHHGDPGTQRAAVGSDEESACLAMLSGWMTHAFSKSELEQLQLLDDVSHRGTPGFEWDFDRYRQGALVHRLFQYLRASRASVDQVFEGDGLVRLSFRVTDGLGRAHVVLFRTSDEDPVARPHLDDSMHPIAPQSVDERWVLHAMRGYTAQHLPARIRELWWQGAEPMPADLDPSAVRMFMAMRDYMQATSPRLLQAMRLKDGGSIELMFLGGGGQIFSVFFDHAIGSDTSGRIKLRPGELAERALVEFGSDEERRLLAQLDAYVARSERADDGDRDAALVREQLREYRRLKG